MQMSYPAANVIISTHVRRSGLLLYLHKKAEHVDLCVSYIGLTDLSTAAVGGNNSN